MTGLGNTKPSHIKLGINSCRTKSIANSIERSDDKFSKQLIITESKLEKQISALRVEMNEKFTDIHKQFSDTHKQISEIHKQIAIQTKWILIAILGAVVLLPIINRIMLKLLP